MALPLPRRVPHDGRDDRHLPGAAPMRRRRARARRRRSRRWPAPRRRRRDGRTMHGARTTRRRRRCRSSSPPSRPARIDVVAGDTVRWTNDSVRVHTVNAVDGSWSSPRIVGDDSVQPRFDTPGDRRLLLRAAPVHARRGRRPRRAARRPDRARQRRAGRTLCAGAPPCRPARASRSRRTPAPASSRPARPPSATTARSRPT